MYVIEIVRLCGTHVFVFSNKDARFTSKLLPSLQQTLDTKLYFSTIFYLQIDG